MGTLLLDGEWTERALDDELDRGDGEGRWGVGGPRDEDDMFGRVRTRDGCCRMRSNPDGPRPRSSSKGDLQNRWSASRTVVPFPRSYLGSWSYSDERESIDRVIQSSVLCVEKLRESSSGDSDSGPMVDDRGLVPPVDTVSQVAYREVLEEK